MATKIQETAQAPGPHAPSVGDLAITLIKRLPLGAQVEAMSINGQTGVVTVEYRHEDLSLATEVISSA